MPRSIEFLGESFEVAEKVGLMPLMRFAAAAKRGAETESMDGLVAMYELIEQCVAPQDWERFQQHCIAQHADEDDLLEKFVPKAIEVISGRPTERPSDSSAGSPVTGTSSEGGSSSQVIARLEAQGRPDLALVVQQAQQAS